MFRSTYWRVLAFAAVLGISVPAAAPPRATTADAQVYVDMGNGYAGALNYDEAIKD